MARVSIFAANGVNIERHAYCLCLHVRPTTIFLALINLAGSLICACFTLFFIVNNDSKSNYLPYRLVRDEFSRVTGISVLMYLLLTLVSAMLLYGVIKSKPSYILPFFGIQFIDYLFTMPQFLASIYSHPYNYYMSKAELELHEQYKGTYTELPRHAWLNGHANGANGAPNHIHTLLFMTMVLVFKTYFLCVVWKCYRYLHMKEFILPLALNNATVPSDAMMAPIVITQSNVPPPNYEEATKFPEYKPPDYITVVQATNQANQPDAEQPNTEATSPTNQQEQQQTQSKNV